MLLRRGARRGARSPRARRPPTVPDCERALQRCYGSHKFGTWGAAAGDRARRRAIVTTEALRRRHAAGGAPSG